MFSRIVFLSSSDFSKDTEMIWFWNTSRFFKNTNRAILLGDAMT